MKIDGKGLIIMNVHGTMNYFSFKDNEELHNMLWRFYKQQGIRDITVIDCESKNVYFVDDDYSYDIIMSEIIKESE